jgi:hypothetical protein
VATATVLTNSGKRTTATRMLTALGRSPLLFIGIGTAGTTAAITDTALGTEVETRATGTESVVTTTVTSDTYQTLGTITATAGRTITEAGTFDASTVGNMGVSATFPAIGLLTGDSLQLTVKVAYT